MNKLSDSMKKFIGNKNTVTIIGVLLCIGLLYWGYNYRIEQKVVLTKVPYANQTIQPRTKITAEMISFMNVPAEFLKYSNYYRDSESLIGKYSNYNTIIAEGSVFYEDLVIDESILPNSAFINIKPEDTPINYRVDMDSTYANSMMPGDFINIYFKGVDESGNIMFGKFFSNIEILDVKDSSGRHVFEITGESRTPAYMLFALPEDMHLLFRKALYLQGSYSVELILVPSTEELTEEDSVFVSSADIQNFINERTKMVSVNEIYSETADQVGEGTGEENQQDGTNTN